MEVGGTTRDTESGKNKAGEVILFRKNCASFLLAVT